MNFRLHDVITSYLLLTAATSDNVLFDRFWAKGKLGSRLVAGPDVKVEDATVSCVPRVIIRQAGVPRIALPSPRQQRRRVGIAKTRPALASLVWIVALALAPLVHATLSDARSPLARRNADAQPACSLISTYPTESPNRGVWSFADVDGVLEGLA
ncbi:hypothetical protein F5X97DRAFT_338330 [Nemania serpens]|nr:hypothetical protein F5X97DRAFT_338330 [Nemania serpens]